MWRLWKFILRHLARAQGFLDPMVVFSSLQHFSKPSEVWVPFELLRSGAVLQARGLINSQAIQNNLDWIWPYWVERQFNPNDKAFVPRAFSLTHINLTHRNWTAVGLPDYPDYPIVDPCGLTTPFFDGWSMDAWIVHENSGFIPSRLAHVGQDLDLQGTFAVLTRSLSDKYNLDSRVEMKREKDDPVCNITFKARSINKAWLLVAVRPYNPEGVSFIRDISLLEGNDRGWLINKKERVYVDKQPAQFIFANYNSGDLNEKIAQVPQGLHSISCVIGMATSAAVYPLEPGQESQVVVRIPLVKEGSGVGSTWNDHLQGSCEIKIPDDRMKFIYDAAIKSIVLHSPGDIYPGPFTYKRFWFRDAAFILNAMTAMRLFRNIEKIIDRFPGRQLPNGYYMSQDGEWDSNGQAIWAIKRYIESTNKPLKKEWQASIDKGAKWIKNKRLTSDKDPVHKGLLPAGFSAEHFGPSDFYYWDDFWGIVGLRAAGLHQEADDLLNTVDNSIASVQSRLPHPGIPPSPTRRLDAGAIGSVVASYPLQLYPPNHDLTLKTVKFLMDKYALQGAFYHELSHSGINIYLSLHIAQVLLRAGDFKFFDIVKSVAELATPTGQWPEAIHPRTKGGCMGDGQHIWACAEWVMMLRNMFVREEEKDRTVILCSGIPPEWLKPHETLFLGPTQTLYGEIAVTIKVTDSDIKISWDAKWHGVAPTIEVRLPGHETHVVKESTNSLKIYLQKETT